MLCHTQSAHLAFPLDFLFNLVADITRYPEFMPWCHDAQITHRLSHNELYARLHVGKHPFCGAFTSHVHMTPGQHIRTHSCDGIIESMNSQWIFSQKGHLTHVGFSICIQLRSRMAQILLGRFIADVSRKIMNAFIMRASVMQKELKTNL